MAVKSFKTLFSSAAVTGHGDRTHLVLIQNTTHNLGWKGSANAQCHIEAIYQGDRQHFINNEPSKAQPSHCFVATLQDTACIYMHLLGTAALDADNIGNSISHLWICVWVLLSSWGVTQDSTICLPPPWRCWDSWPSFPSESIRVYHLPQTDHFKIKVWSLKMTISL